MKRIWFIRNNRRLINSLSLSIGVVGLLYASLSLLALSDADNPFLSRWTLLILPVVQLLLSGFLTGASRYLLTKQECGRAKAGHGLLWRDLLIGSNLYASVSIFFWELHLLNREKGIEGFGLFPLLLFLAAVLIFYVYTVWSYVRKRQGGSKHI